MSPLWLDPSKLNSGQFIELAVSEEAVELDEFLCSFFLLGASECRFLFSYILAELFWIHINSRDLNADFLHCSMHYKL